MSLLARKLMKAPAAGGGDATRTYLGFTSSETDGTSYTFSSQSLGTAQGDRRIVVAVMGRKETSSGEAPTGVTVGGVSASLVVSQQASGDRNSASLWIAEVPSGSTGDIVVTFANTQQRCGVGWWAVYGLESSTATDTAATATSGGSLNIDVEAGGVAFGTANSGSASATFSWTGLTEDFDGAVGTSNGFMSGASIESASASTPLSVSCTATGTSSDQYVAASFR